MTMLPMPAAAPVGMPPPNPATPFPQPSLPPAYGMDPTEASLLASSPDLLPYTGMPTPTVYNPAGAQAYGAQMSAMYKLTGGAISAENDPRTWSADTAAAQTESAIAKIAQVNPDLAKELAEQHGMSVPGDDDGGFWGDIMGAVGKVFEVTHLDDVMELISRPAHILPEIIMDWGKEDVWKNVGDALMGKSDVSWDDVLVDKFGMERNFFTAAMGLVGDIALDPLTYLPLGRLMSMGREVTSMTAGKAIATGAVHEAEEIVAAKAAGATTEALTVKYGSRAVAEADDVHAATAIFLGNGANTLDEAGAAMFAASDVATQAAAKARSGVRGMLERVSARAGRGPAVLQDEANAVLSKVQTAMKGVDPDALPGVMNVAASRAAERGLKIVTGASDKAVTLAYRGKFSAAIEVITKATGWDAKYAETALKRWVKEGTGITPGALGKAKYMRGKAAATQLGGWRFHLNIPILGVRIAPQRVLPKVIPQLDFSLGRRFFAGMSGEMRMVRLMKKGGERELRAYEMFVEKGFTGLKDNFPDIAKKVAGPGALTRPGSVFMSASEQVGKLTGKLSPHAALLRKGGLGGIRLAQFSRQAPALHELALRDMQTVVRADGETLLNGPQGAEFIERAFSRIMLAKPGEATDAAKRELSMKLERYVALSPHDDAASALTEAETVELRELEDWFTAQGEDGLEAATMLKQQAYQSETVPEKSGVPAAIDRYHSDYKDELTPADAATAAGESQHEFLHDAVYVIDGNGRPLDGAIDEDALQDVALDGGVTARGIPVRRARDGIQGPSTGPTQAELNRASRAVARAEAELRALSSSTPPPPRVPTLEEKYGTYTGVTVYDANGNPLPEGEAYVQEVDVDQLIEMQGNELNPEVYIDDKTLGTQEQLVESVRAEGVREPGTIIFDAKTGRAYLGEGNHRAAAAKASGRKTMPVKVVRGSVPEGLGIPVKAKYVPDQSGYVPGQVPPSWTDLKVRKPEVANDERFWSDKHIDEFLLPHAARSEVVAELGDGVEEIVPGDLFPGMERVFRVKDSKGNVVGVLGVPRNGGLSVAVSANSRRKGFATKMYREAEAAGVDIRSKTGGNVSAQGGELSRSYLNQPAAGGVSVVGDDFEATIVKAIDARDKAAAELHQLETPSQELVVSAKNIVTVDLTGNAVSEGTAGMNVPRQIADSVRALMDEAEMTAGKLDEAAEALMDPELRKLAAQVREIGDNVPAGVTRTMTHDGTDGIRVLTKGPDGETVERIIVFRRPDGSIPVARINPHAPHAVQRGGTPIRSATKEAQDAVRRLKGAKDLPGGSKVALDRLVQDTSHLPWQEAEDAIRAQLKAWGQDVPANKTVLEPDFIKALAGKQEAKARAMVAQQAGKAIRTLERLGLTSSVENGGLVGMERVRWALGGSPAVVATMADDAKAAGERNARFLDEKLQPLAQQAEQAARKVQDGHDAYETSLKSVDNVTYEKMLGGRGRPVDADAGDMLTVAQTQGRAVDLGDGMWMTVDDNGTKVFYMTDVSEVDDLMPGGSPPVHELEGMAGDGYTIVMHHTPNERVQTILDSPGIKRSMKGTVEGKGTGVFAYALDRNVKVAPGMTALAVRVPTSSLKAGKEAGTLVADLDVAGDIVGTYPGATVVGTRAVDANGKLLDASDAGKLGVRDRLLDADYRDAGVFDADDVGLAITERMKAAGVSGALEKRAAAKGHASAQEALEAEKVAAQDLFGKAHMEQTAAIGEVERLKTLMSTEAAQVRPALIPKTEMSMTSAGFEELDIPGFEGLVMPTFMAQELQRAVNGFKGLDEVHAQFRKFNSWWKSHATWMWPSFHIRNMYGAFFNNILGGVDIKDYIMAGRIRFAAREFESAGKAGKWGNKLIRETDPDMLEIMRMNGQFTMMGKDIEDLTYGDLAEMTSSMGVTSSNGQPLMDARLSASETERGGKVWIEKHKMTKPYANFAKGVGTGTENVMRAAAFVRGMKTYGTAPEARVFTMLRHGDYADLTDFEYGVVRDIIPFYKWMRTNTPFQVHQLLESPAKLLAVTKLQGAAYTAAGVDPDDQKYKMPKWMGESFNIPFGSADENGMFDMVSLDLPMSDLHKTATDYFTSTLPLFQPFFENFVAKKDLFTGAPMDGKPIPLTGIWNMPGIRDILKVTQFADEGEDGELYTTDAKRNMLAVIPEVTKFKDWLWADPERTNSRIGSFVSAMVAFPLRAADEAAMTSAELDFYYSTLEPEMMRLREMGYPLPTVAQMEATVGTVDQALALQGITPRPPLQPTFGLAA